MANRTQLQTALQKPYNRILFSKDVLMPVFGECLTLYQNPFSVSEELNESEKKIIDKVFIYGNITLEDITEITCYEILLKPNVRIEHSKVTVQRYVRKLLTAGQASFINFISPINNNVWRFTLTAKEAELTSEGIKEKATHSKRYTYLLGPLETCKTAAERFETLSTQKQINFEALLNAFSVEKLSKAFFDEYTLHYKNFCNYLQDSNFAKTVFKVSLPTNASKEDEDKAYKPIRDFTKKLLGRIVFLYFVQKKGWLGASDKKYKDGSKDFMLEFFRQSGGGESFYSVWLRVLFFDTLNRERSNDEFEMPDGKKVKIPFLNGGLFDKEELDEKLITFKSKLFHNPDNEDEVLTKKNSSNSRGFLDFLNAFNFTVHEDSPDEHTVAVDPEMLGHIFENLLEDNKDKGAFYTPKEIVHYMCQESLIEYLATHLGKEYTIYRQIDNAQYEFFGNETRTGQLKMVEELGDKALDRNNVNNIVMFKEVSRLSKQQLKRIDQLLDTVKICDPAIGSGAFPMGLLQEIYSIKEVIAYELKQEWKPAKVKENIIQNSIFGVDIEKGAVDIARLRFWLSLVVDEDMPRALPNLDYKIVVGDSLVSKFEDEIIEIDWNNKRQETYRTITFLENIQLLLKEIAATQKKSFKPETKNKKKLHTEIRNLKLELLINQISFNKVVYLSKNVEKDSFIVSDKNMKYNSELNLKRKYYDVLIHKLETLKKQTDKPFVHFDWKLDFPEVLNPNLFKDEKERGFDIVIGNPPYRQLQKMKEESKYLEKAGFETFTRTGDIYCLFYEQGNKLLKANGTLCFITSNTWMRTKFGELLRKYFAEQTNPIKLLNFEDTRIFQTATVETNIILTKNEKFKKDLKAVVVKTDYSVGTSIHNYFLSNSIDLPELPIEGWIILNKQDYEIKIGISAKGKQLKDCDIEFYRGFLTGYNDAFFIDALKRKELIAEDPRSKEIIKPLLRGREIRKYSFKFNEQYVIFSHNGLKENIRKKQKEVPRINVERDYKAVYKHLLQYKDKSSPLAKKNQDGTWQTLVDRADQGDHWTNLRDCAYINLFEKPKLIWLAITDKPAFAFDDKHYITAPAYFLSGENLKYLMSLLNSKAMEWYLDKTTSSTGAGANQWSKIYVEQLPIPEIKNEKTQQKFETLADYLIFLNDESKPSVNLHTSNTSITPVFEDVLNMMVYELYFEQHMKEEEIDVLKFIDFESIENKIPELQKEIIGKEYLNLLLKTNEIRNRIILSNIKSPNIIARINSSTH